jgi:hypothetical protein
MAIRQVKLYLPPSSLKSLYFALIHPHLVYGIVARGNAKQTHIKRTQILQKRAIRYITHSHYNEHTEPLFKSTKILKISDLYTQQVILFMYDFYNNKLPKSFLNSFQVHRNNNSHPYPTRHTNLFVLSTPRSDFTARLPCFKFPTIANSSSDSIINSPSRHHLKTSTKNNSLNMYSSHT